MIDPTSVETSPPEYQGSVLGTIVAGDIRLGQLLAHCNAIERLRQSVQAELAALRASKAKEKTLRFTVGNDIETYSGKSALEICWETLERVQYLTRRLEVFPGDLEYLHRKNSAFKYFLIRVAGIAGGDVAESIAMGAPRTEDIPGADYLIRTVGYVPLPRLFDPISPETKAKFLAHFFSEKEIIALPSDRNGLTATHHVKPRTRYALDVKNLLSRQDCIGEDCTEEQIAAWYPYTYRGVPNSSSVPSNFYSVTNESEHEEKRFASLPLKPWANSSREVFLGIFGELFTPVREEAHNRLITNERNWVSLEEYKARAGHLSIEVTYLPNWCPICKEYVAWSHDGTGGIDCEDRLATIAEKRAAKLANATKRRNRTTHRVSKKHLQRRGRGPTGINRQEDLAVCRADAAFKRWLTESKMVAERHPNAPPKVRSLEKIFSESRYFPI